MTPIAPYLGVRSAMNPAFSPATGCWYFLLNWTDTHQIFGLNGPLGWPEMLTDYPERVSGLIALQRAAGLVFARDAGGNERHRLFWLDLKTRAIRPLTQNPDAISRFGAESPDGAAIAYTATDRNGRDFDVYVASIEQPGSARRVIEAEGDYAVAGWNRQNALLIVNRRGLLDSALFRYDLPTGRCRQISPPGAKAAFLAPVLLDDGTVYALSDWERDLVSLVRIGSDGRMEHLLHRDREVDNLAVASDGSRLAYTLNEDGYSRLVIRDLALGRETEVAGFEHQVILELVFAPGADMLAVTHTSARTNLNISVVDRGGLSVTPWTQAPMVGLDQEHLTEPDLVHFPTFDGLEIPAFCYRPRGAGDLPVIVSVHGGPESQERPQFSGWYQYLTAHGYAVVAPNVRGSTGYGKHYASLDDRERRVDAVRDLGALLDWIRSEPGLDGERVAVYGGSYGGFMVLSAITEYPGAFRAAVDVVGITNLETFLERTGPWRRALREIEYGSLDTDRELLRRLSPIHRVDRIRTPLFVVHGQNDPRVPLFEAEQIVAALRSRGRPVEWLVYPDEGHGIAKLQNRRDLYPKIVAFLDCWLKGGEPCAG